MSKWLSCCFAVICEQVLRILGVHSLTDRLDNLLVTRHVKQDYAMAIPSETDCAWMIEILNQGHRTQISVVTTFGIEVSDILV